MIQISNESLNVRISRVGAEMQCLTDVRSGREYLWQGDAEYWSGRSPILFPIVGGMWNGECRIDGKAYRIPKHGFVKGAEWALVAQQADAATFRYTPTEENLGVFPWQFALEVTYRLEGRKLVAELRVENRSDRTMWFQAGGHPGLALPGFAQENAVDAYLRLEGRLESLLRAGDQGCIEPERQPVPLTSDGLVPVCVESFANEALIFDGHQVQAVTLLDLDRKPVCRVESTAPVWLFWSPQGVHSPFVCAEPWYGLCDHQGFEGAIEERPFMQHAEPGETWTGGYSVEITDEE